MKFLLSIFSVITLILTISCSEDNPTNSTSESALKGIWIGNYVSNSDSIYYRVNLNEGGGTLSGSAELFARNRVTNGSTTITQEITRKGTISGYYTKPSIKVEFPSDTTLFFIGNLSTDSTKITGKIELINELNGSELKFDLEMNKIPSEK